MNTPVRNRRVFYVPGYDPFPPRRYRELYRREAAVQASLSGHEIALAPSRPGDPYGWEISARIEGAAVESRFEVLVWDDLVRASMRGGVLATYVRLMRTAWIYAASGALPRLMQLRKGPVLAAAWPVAVLLLQAALALGAALLAIRLIAPLVPAPVHYAGAVAAWPVLVLFERLDRHLYAHYLLNDFAFSAQHRGAYPAALEERLAGFRTRVTQALASEVDEVLIVGHSSGAHLAVSLLADTMRAAHSRGPALSLLTLGQAIPMASFLPDAHRLRADLALLAARDDIAWVDVSAPGDGCCFALCDPVAVSGVAPPAKRWPLVISAAFSRTLTPETWRRLRWRFFRLHFQYLCAFDASGLTPQDYDYFRITAGPQTLGSRHAGRSSSKGRIERVASPYTSRAA